MLRKLGPGSVRAGETTGGTLFPQKLEFNAPAHGVWNIVHIGMLVPQAHQIYICAINCMRGVVLTAAELGASDRFSCVVLKEEDLIDGTVEEVTLSGIRDVLHKLPELPPCVLVFPVCTHHFLGINMSRIYRQLEEEFPQVDFIRAFMDPIMQKQGLPPDQRLRWHMYDPLRACPPREKTAGVLGSDFAVEGDLRDEMQAAGWELLDIQHCSTYDEYKRLAQASLMFSVYPGGVYGAARTAERLGRAHLYLPMTFDLEELQREYQALFTALGCPLPDLRSKADACGQALEETRQLLDGAPVVIDATVHPRPLGLARMLLRAGFHVTEIFLDGVSEEETADRDWLHRYAPDVILSSTILPEQRVRPRSSSEKTLAIGQKAAWFYHSGFFVNLVQGGGLWGFSGILTMTEMMREAWMVEKDTRRLISRKGLGCCL